MTRRHLLAFPAIVRAQSLQERGRRLLTEAITALGGDKFTGMTDRVEEGRAYTYYRERLNGFSRARFETVYHDIPGKVVFAKERQTFGKKLDYYVLFEGENKGWDVTFRGAKSMPEDVVQQWRENLLRNGMYILRCRMDEKGIIFERRGSEVFENQPVEIVDVTDSENRSIAIYLHASTKLPVRVYWRRQNGRDKGWDEGDTRYAKYRDTQGVMWPWATTRSRNGERNFELYADTVRLNTGLTPASLSIPSNLTILD
jgi:hypothetical protein